MNNTSSKNFIFSINLEIEELLSKFHNSSSIKEKEFLNMQINRKLTKLSILKTKDIIKSTKIQRKNCEKLIDSFKFFNNTKKYVKK